MKRVSGKIYLSNHFFGLQIFDTYGKDMLGYNWSGQFMSGHVRSGLNILYQKIWNLKFLDPKYFG